MRSLVVLTLALVVAGAGAGRAQNQLPDWAYNAVNTPAGAKPAPDDGLPKKLAGSSGAFTLPQIRDGFGPADWYPGDHPAMPPVVASAAEAGRARVQPLSLPERQGTS